MPRDLLEPETVRSTAQLHAAYIGAFDLYASQPSEASLYMAYELGRRAVELAVSVPELARIHHEAVRMALQARTPADDDVVTRGADFLAESLSAFEMVRRGYAEERERAHLERQQAAIVRRLSALLADTSLTLDTRSSLSETLLLVAEAACELTQSRCCIARVLASGRGQALTAVSGVRSGGSCLVAELTALGGKKLGSLHLLGKKDREFTELDEAILVQLAQMAAGAIERTHLYA